VEEELHRIQGFQGKAPVQLTLPDLHLLLYGTHTFLMDHVIVRARARTRTVKVQLYGFFSVLILTADNSSNQILRMEMQHYH
jgi:hypothetical protein